MKKKILAVLMSIVMLVSFAVPAFAADDAGISTDDILASDALQEIMGSDGFIDITNVVMDIIGSVGSIDLASMGKEKALAFIQNIIDMVGGVLVDTKTNVEVFADDPIEILDNLFGLNAGEVLNPDDGEEEPDEDDPDEIIIDLGDIDGDGKVTAADARLVLRRAANLISFTADQDWLADVDDDGKVTAADARIILRVAAGLESFE